MINYIKADLYRMFHKKSFYIYTAGIIVGFLFVMFLISSVTNIPDLVQYAPPIFELGILFVGGFVYSMVYNDDLNAKSLPSAIGFGVNKPIILLSKTIISTVISIISLILMGVVYFAACNVFGIKMSGDDFVTLLKMLVRPVLLTVVYTALASIAAYGTQKSTISLTIYILLASGISSMINMILSLEVIKNIFGNINEYLVENIVAEIESSIVGHYVFDMNTGNMILQTSDFSIIPWIQYAASLAAAIVIAALAFDRKELEF